MTDNRPRVEWRVAAVVIAIVIGACGAGGGGDEPPVPPPSTSPRTADPEPPPDDTLVITQNGLPGLGLEMTRESYNVSSAEVEAAFGETFDNAGQTDDCGLSSKERFGVVAITDVDLAVHGFMVERPDAATQEGIRLGSTTDDIIETYGKESVFAREVPSRSGGQLIWVTDLETPGEEPTRSSFHYGFDTDESGQVTRIRAGFWPHVADVDFCSDNATRGPQTGWPLA